ncbi:MAG: lysylphosphatidylglycerol synthase transmembrane domain-containing protein [Thermodesulfobacteriota bacterium]|nr:lysylphosphatidylglycerol synthase transmembrane domain-containing protein [Thermodesulfobacteriota bacterium]
MSKKLKVILKCIVSFALLSSLVIYIDMSKFFDLVKSINVSLYLMAVLIFLMSQLLSPFRWQLLLKSKEVIVSYQKLLKFYFVGMFFNLFLPSNIGGDVVKVYDLYRYTSKGTESVASVLVDRLTGVMGLTTILFIAYIGYYREIPGNELKIILIPFLVFFLLVLPASLVNSYISVRARWVANAVFCNSLLEKVNHGVDTTIEYWEKKGPFVKAVLMSIVLQGSHIIVFYIIALSLGVKVPMKFFFIFVPLGMMVSMIPISINGLGIREWGFVYLFSKIGLSASFAMTLSLLWFLSVTVNGLFGGIIVINRLQDYFSGIWGGN